MRKFQWNSNDGGFNKFDPNVVGKEIHRLRREFGKLTTAMIVEQARKKSSPLHDIFPWDDSIAAEIGRKYIARHLVQAIEVVIIKPNKEPVETRAFVSLRTQGRERSYSYVESELHSEKGRARLIRQAWLQLRAWKERYSNLKELSSIFEVIDAHSDALEKVG